MSLCAPSNFIGFIKRFCSYNFFPEFYKLTIHILLMSCHHFLLLSSYISTLWSSFIEVIFLCVPSHFCCFYLHFTLSYLSIYSVPTACSYVLFCNPAIYRRERRQRAMPSKSQNPKAVFQYYQVPSHMAPQHIPTFFSKSILAQENLYASPVPNLSLFFPWIYSRYMLQNESFTSRSRICIFWNLFPLSNLAIICASFLDFLLGSFGPPQIL